MKPRLFDIIVVILLVINLLLTAIILDSNTSPASDQDVFDADIQPLNEYVVSATESNTVVYTDIDDLLDIIEDDEIVDRYYTLQAKYEASSDATELIADLEDFQSMLQSKGYSSAADEMPRVIEAIPSGDLFLIDSATAVVLYEVVITQ